MVTHAVDISQPKAKQHIDDSENDEDSESEEA